MPLPPQPLSHEQRLQICAFLGLGATRRMAVKYVGCRVLDLNFAMKRDRDFRLKVLQHELRPEIEVLRSLLEAARDPKQWRAAGWVLERFYPRRYAARKADALTKGQIQTQIKDLDLRGLVNSLTMRAARPPRKGSRPKAKSPAAPPKTSESQDH